MPVMVISFTIGVLLIFEKFFLSTSTQLHIQIIDNIVNVLAGTIISIAALNFYISISTERELIDSVQTRITGEADCSAMNDEALKSILRNIAIVKLQQNNSVANNSTDLNLRALANELAGSYWNNVTDCVHFEQYDRKIVITLTDSGIGVRTTTRLVYCNLSHLSGKYFRVQPVFPTKTEAESFKIVNILYNKKI